MADPSALLPFAQLDLPGRLPIGEGRFLVRPPNRPDAEPDVLAVRALGARRAGSRLRRRRPAAVSGDPAPTPLPLARVTMIKAIAFSDPSEAAGWLRRVAGDEELAAGLVSEVVRALNRAVQAYRVAAPDPYAADLHAGEAVAVRFGFGTGQEVSEGRWSEALELAERRRRSFRSEMVDAVGAQERIAAVLGGRDEVRPEEALLVEAERAAEQGRSSLAALTVALALEALVAAGGDPGEAHDPASRLRRSALEGGQIETQNLESTLRLARRAIRAAGRAG